MRSTRLNEFLAGWLVGDFTPSLIRTKEIEVGIKSFTTGDSEPAHYQIRATEINIVVSGECLLNGIALSAGDILTIEPGEVGGFEAVTDCVLVVLKHPSLPADKVLSAGGQE